MKPTAYITKDRRMLIFADSPNMLPSDTSNLIPLFELGAIEGEPQSGDQGMDSCRGFKVKDSVAYYRFHASDKPILGFVRELVDREGARGAWISDVETGEVYFAPFSRLAHIAP